MRHIANIVKSAGVEADAAAGSRRRRGASRPVARRGQPVDSVVGYRPTDGCRGGDSLFTQRGPPAPRRKSRRGQLGLCLCDMGIIHRLTLHQRAGGEGLTLALRHGHLSNNGLHINNLTVNTSTNNHVVSQLCDCAQHCA